MILLRLLRLLLWLSGLGLVEHGVAEHASHHTFHLLEGVSHARSIQVGEEWVSLLSWHLLLPWLGLGLGHGLSRGELVRSLWSHLAALAVMHLVDLGTVGAGAKRDGD